MKDYSESDNMAKEKIVQIRITEARKDRWQKRADKDEKSMTQFVIDCVEQQIRDKDILDKIEELIRELIS